MEPIWRDNGGDDCRAIGFRGLGFRVLGFRVDDCTGRVRGTY